MTHETRNTVRPTIGVIGLGLLGGALAVRLLHRGFAVVGYDIESSRRGELAAEGVIIVASAAEVAADCQRVLFSLPTSEIVEQVVARIDTELRADQTIIDTTTGDPQRTAALAARLAQRKVNYLDATIVGSSADARRGAVVVIAGGERAAFDACADVFAAFASRWFHVGGCGDGARMKLVVNLVLGLNRAALAEGLALARRLGLDPVAALAVLRAGAAYSRTMDAKGEKMLAGDFAPQARLDQHLKDVRLILEAGQRADARLPLSTLHRELLEQLVAAGLGSADNSAIIRAFE